MKRPDASRRRFLRTASLLSPMGVAAPFALNLAAMGSAAAQTSSDYRALVCLFMMGGNDHGNTVIATDPGSWSAYQTLRGAGSSPIALPAPGQPGGVLPISPATAQPGRSFALHPSLAPLQQLFNAGQAAVVANVGPLLEPMTKAQYQANENRRPSKLFSHNDQQSTWQAWGPEGARYGWGGRMGDMMAAMNGMQTFTCMATSGNAVWLAGQDTLQYKVGSNGATPIRALTGSLYGSPMGAQVLQQIVTADSANLFESAHASVTRRAIDAQASLNAALIDAQGLEPLPTGAGNNGIAAQLNTVARIIGGRSSLSARRQVFFVSMGGFDTHDNQATKHAGLMAELAEAIAYFQRLLADPQIQATQQTTLFTASDFGRTMTSNGDGTDHGWGGHHFVVGGAVRGGDIYGRFPEVGDGTNDDVGRGRLLPSVSVDQYAATMGRWFGLANGQLADVFPNLGNFGATQDLGFMT
ncbi:MAG: DUF1501 domain-containing protein [Burkholderiaceae bacterium]